MYIYTYIYLHIFNYVYEYAHEYQHTKKLHTSIHITYITCTGIRLQKNNEFHLFLMGPETYLPIYIYKHTYMPTYICGHVCM